MVLKQMAREYERRRQKILLCLRRKLTASREKELKEEIHEIDGMIEKLRSAENIDEVFSYYQKRVKTLISKGKKKSVHEIKVFLHSLAYAHEHANHDPLGLQGKEYRDLKKEYREKVKPVIDDFLSEEY